MSCGPLACQRGFTQRCRGLVLRNVRLKLLDLGGEGRNVLGQSLDGRLRHLDLLLGLLDNALILLDHFTTPVGEPITRARGAGINQYFLTVQLLQN